MSNVAADSAAVARSGHGIVAVRTADVAVIIVNYNSGPHLQMPRGGLPGRLALASPRDCGR